MGYVNIRYRPTKHDLCAVYRADTKEWSARTIAEHIAAEAAFLPSYKPVVYSIKKQEMQIAFPKQLFEITNVTQALSFLGQSMAKVPVQLQDVHFPLAMRERFPGPRFGVQGIRKKLNVSHRPLLGMIVHGKSPKDFAEAAYAAWKGGADIVQDHPAITHMLFSAFKERLRRVLKKKEQIEKETGEKKMLIMNVNGTPEEMLKRAAFLPKDCFALLDVSAVGWGCVQELRKKGRCGIALWQGVPPSEKIHPKVWAKLATMVGGDTIHIGTSFLKTKHHHSKPTFADCALADHMYKKTEHTWQKEVMPMVRGSIHAKYIPSIIHTLGEGCIIMADESSHPKGMEKTAQALRQAIAATLQGIPLQTYAQAHSALQTLLDHKS